MRDLGDRLELRNWPKITMPSRNVPRVIQTPNTYCGVAVLSRARTALTAISNRPFPLNLEVAPTKFSFGRGCVALLIPKYDTRTPKYVQGGGVICRTRAHHAFIEDIQFHLHIAYQQSYLAFIQDSERPGKL